MGFSLFKSNSSDNKAPLWSQLDSMEAWAQILERSHGRPQLVFKHSTRCGISRVVLSNFERELDPATPTEDRHLLDLLSYREVSAAVAADTEVFHQSPQAIVIRQGKVLYSDSHNGISAAAAYAQMG